MYIHRYESIHALGHAAQFTRENWIEWFLPLLLLLSPLFLFAPSLLAIIFLNSSSEFLPSIILVQAAPSLAAILGLSGEWIGLVFSIIGVVLAHWFMFFRGFLFKDLESGSRRRRMFDAKSG